MDKFLDDMRENPTLYLFFLLLPLIVYAFEFSTFPMTFDEIKRVNSDTSDIAAVQQGRWGMYFLTELFSKNPVLPIVGIYLSSLLLCLSFRWLLIECNQVKHNVNFTAVIALVISYPSLYFLYAFSTISFIVGAIYLLSLLITIIIFNNSRLIRYLSIPLFVVNLAIYQASLAVMLCMLLIRFYSASKFDISKSIDSLVIILVSIAMYFLSIEPFINLLGTVYSGYIDGFSAFSFDFDYIYLLMSSFIERSFDHYLFSISIYSSSNLPLVILSCFSVLYISFIHRKNLFKLLTLLAIVFVPFTMELLSVQSIPTRTLIALPLALGFIIITFLNDIFKKYKHIWLISLTFVFFSALNNMIALSRLSFLDANSWTQDKVISQMFLNRIYNSSEYMDLIDKNKSIETHLVGYIDRKENQYNKEFESIGKSFFSWGANELQNFALFFNSMGFDEFIFANLASVHSNLDTIRSMPKWPDIGSIKFVNDILIVKISDYTEAQVLTVCNDSLSDSKSLSCLVSYNPQSIPFRIEANPLKKNNSLKFNLKEHSLKKINNGNFIKSITGNTFTSTSTDAQILLPLINLDTKYAILSIEGQYNNDDLIELYFYSDKGYSFNQVLRLNIPKGELMINLILPSYLFKDGLRVDPTIQKQSIEKFNLNVWGFSGEIS